MSDNTTKFQLAQFGPVVKISIIFAVIAAHIPEVAVSKIAMLFGTLFVPLYVYLDRKGASVTESEFGGVDIS